MRTDVQNTQRPQNGNVPNVFGQFREFCVDRWEAPMAKLNSSEIDRGMKNLSGWTREGEAIRKQFTFATFPDAIAFVNRLAVEAEKADHHPDILIRYKRVTLTWSTHDEGGLTDKDFAGAAMSDRVA